MGKESPEKVKERVTKYRQKKKKSDDLQKVVTRLEGEVLSLQKRVTILENKPVKKEGPGLRLKPSVTQEELTPKSLFDKVVAEKMQRLRNG
jgi:hypothetical protein